MVPEPVPLPDTVSVRVSGLVTPRIVKLPFTSKVSGPVCTIFVDRKAISRFCSTSRVPGVEEKDIDVRIENNTLVVHGERKFEKEEKEENYRRVERQYGSFTRSFTLPNSVDPGQVSADYDKGVLKINLAKKAEAKPKQIKIGVGSERSEATSHGKGALKASA